MDFANELRKRRAAYSDFYQKFEVFLRSADMSSTEIVDCVKRLIESYTEIDAKFPDELVHSLHFVNREKLNASRCNANVSCQQSVCNLSKYRYCTGNLSAVLWNECNW